MVATQFAAPHNGSHRDRRGLRMAEQPTMDPMGLWHEMLSQWERGLNTIASQAGGSSELSGAMQQITALSLRMQQTAGEAMEKSLRALNLPTRSDILELGERISRVEAALKRLEESSAVPRKPPAT
jgi:hypothetical protein